MYIDFKTRRILANITPEEWEAIAKLANQMALNSDKELKTNEVMQLIATMEFDEKVEKFLNDIGVPNHLRGYLYLKETMIFLYENPDRVYWLNDIYDEIGKKYEVIPARVDVSIRECLNKVFENKNNPTLESVYTYYPSLRERKHNKSVIAAFTEYVKKYM